MKYTVTMEYLSPTLMTDGNKKCIESGKGLYNSEDAPPEEAFEHMTAAAQCGLIVDW